MQDVTLTTIQESQISEQEQQFAQHLAIVDYKWEGEEEDEDDRPILRPKVVSEARLDFNKKSYNEDQLVPEK
ncbi:hypothetical protein H5410_031394 [Solanum commersonii]|uniref:Uncharacterized protein n=1 Tax=Solanum commersonii TaxID=4109 RepID=A0A9J5YK23_SOLCO|nr:hypothetical protein H5410_031394 [Solanum commersonii]